MLGRRETRASMECSFNLLPTLHFTETDASIHTGTGR